MKTFTENLKSGKLFYSFSLMIALTAILLTTNKANAQVAINTDNSAPAASAMLDVKATGLGFLAPRMTFAQRPAAPATGLMIYQTDADPGYYYFDGAAWQKVGRAGSDFWLPNGSNIYFNAGKVSIGTMDPMDFGLNVSNYVAGKGAVRGIDDDGFYTYAEGQLGFLNFSGNPAGLPLDVNNIGVFGMKPANGFNGAAIYGWNNDDNETNYGGIFITDGVNIGINYGIYSTAVNSSTNYAGTFMANGVTAGTNYGLYSEASNGAANLAGFFKGRVEVEANSSGSDVYSPVFRSAVTHNISTDTYAVDGYSVPAPGYGIGVHGEGGFMGVNALANATTYPGGAFGLYASAYGSAGTRYGVYGYAYNTGTSAVGVYGTAGGAITNWAGYFDGDLYVSSDVRIGTTVAATGYALSVNGKVACEEILIDDSGFWPDYVFGEDYDLMSIDEFEQSINENNHLPGMPSAKEIEENGGHHIGEIQKKTLEKVEELSLYIIELNNRMKILEKENQELKAQVSNQ